MACQTAPKTHRELPKPEKPPGKRLEKSRKNLGGLPSALSLESPDRGQESWRPGPETPETAEKSAVLAPPHCAGDRLTRGVRLPEARDRGGIGGLAAGLRRLKTRGRFQSQGHSIEERGAARAREPDSGSKRRQEAETPRTGREPRPGRPRRTSGDGAWGAPRNADPQVPNRRPLFRNPGHSRTQAGFRLPACQPVRRPPSGHPREMPRSLPRSSPRNTSGERRLPR